MNIVHKFYSDLEQLESHQIFCGQPLSKECKILIIGTFNPDDKSCSKTNEATWFYGRDINKFWQYIPECLGASSLKSDESKWRKFCVDHGIVIVDLIKSIEDVNQLEDFGDDTLESRINVELSNMKAFDFCRAFKGIHFEKVIYTRKTWSADPPDAIPKLLKIREMADKELVSNGIVDSYSSIANCYAPWKKEVYVKHDWCRALTPFRTT